MKSKNNLDKRKNKYQQRNTKQDIEFGKAMEADMLRVDNEMDKTEGLFDWNSFDKEKKDSEAGLDLEFIDRMYSPDTDPNKRNGLHGQSRTNKKKE